MHYCDAVAGRKFRILALLATISVVVIHTNYLENMREVPLAWWIGNVIGNLQRWAVPWFFIVSGFFFERAFNGNRVSENFLPFVNRKKKVLLLPYIYWGAGYGFVAMTLLKVGVAIQSGDSDIWRHTIFHLWGQWAFLDSLVGVTHAPLVGALWYVRVLLLVFFTAPIWISLFRFSKWVGLALAIFLVVYSPISGVYQEAFPLPGGIRFCFKLNSLGWIFMGMSFSIFKLEKYKVGMKSVLAALILSVILCLLPLPWEFYGIDTPWWGVTLHRIHPVAVFVALWGFGDKVSAWLPAELPWPVSICFWIYCMHHPITGCVRALGHVIIGGSIISRFVMQATGWFVVLLICVVVGLCIRRKFPRLYSALCGGR